MATSSDLAGNQATKTVTFRTNASVYSLKTLVTRFADMKWIDPRVAARLQKALDEGVLGDFIETVQAHQGKKITKDAAVHLLRDAHSVIDSLKALVNRLAADKSISGPETAKKLLEALDEGNLDDFAQKVREESGKHIKADAAKLLLQGLEFLLKDEKQQNGGKDPNHQN